MKLPDKLKDEIDRMQNIGFALDIGFSYPYELIELYHLYNAKKCIGVDLKKKENSVSCSFIADEISEATQIERRKVSNIIRDCDHERELYNSYKLYTSLILDKTPLNYSQYGREIELHYSKSIQQYLKNDNRWIPFYDLILVSKVLSHIDPNEEENGEWVLDKLIAKLSERGLLYLRLNSDDYEVQESHGVLDSTILAPFNEKRLNIILNKIEVIDNETIARDDGKREYHIIGKKKNDL